MISQIIFFIAVALLIILLARRVYAKRSWTGKVGHVLYEIGHQIGRSVSTLFNGGWSVIKNRVPRSGRTVDRPTAVAPTTINPGEQHHFWQEEAVADRLEIASHFEEGDRLLKDKKYPEAEQFFLKAAATNPKDPKVYARLGLIYLQQKNYSDAIEALKVAVKIDKHNPSRHYNLSLAYMGNGDVQKAIASVREAITLDPVTPKYRTLLEQLLNG